MKKKVISEGIARLESITSITTLKDEYKLFIGSIFEFYQFLDKILDSKLDLFSCISCLNSEIGIGLNAREIKLLENYIKTQIPLITNLGFSGYINLSKEKFRDLVANALRNGVSGFRGILGQYPFLHYHSELFNNLFNSGYEKFEYVGKGNQGVIIGFDDKVTKFYYDNKDHKTLSLNGIIKQESFYNSHIRILKQNPEFDLFKIDKPVYSTLRDGYFVTPKINGNSLFLFPLLDLFSQDFNLTSNVFLSGKINELEIIETLKHHHLNNNLKTNIPKGVSIDDIIFKIGRQQKYKNVESMIRILGINEGNNLLKINEYELLHRINGCIHEDFHSGNIMVIKNNGNYNIQFIDFDKSTIKLHPLPCNPFQKMHIQIIK